MKFFLTGLAVSLVIMTYRLFEYDAYLAMAARV